ncbi:MAG: hypothetical protein GX759_00045, partial [Thermoanaerobacterales bacterium]|nr:hypothetical protein [Thermoanaerobacterales bacterium]
MLKKQKLYVSCILLGMIFSALILSGCGTKANVDEVVVLVCFFPIIISLLEGLSSVD